MTTTVLKLPHEYTPREYQKPIWNAFFNEGKKRLIHIWHRRAGKDKTALNIMLCASQQRVGTYYYLFPQLKQAKRNIWKGIDGEGKRFIDHIPKELIRNKNNTDMSVEMVNGSIFQLGGADRYDSLMGSNPVGIVFSEYSLQNPSAWVHLEPILMENKGWSLFQTTPRGYNHAYDLFQMAQSNDQWFSEKLTVEDTKRVNGEPVITIERIEAARQSGTSEEMIQQEYYCSFDAAVRGAYFSYQLRKAEDAGRIREFEADPTFGIYTFWDLGTRDATAIWFAQLDHGKIYLIHYYENQGQSIQHYINYINDYASKRNFSYITHFSPHDGNKREYGTGKTILQTAQDLGLRFSLVPRISRKSDAIEMARNLIPRCVFHKEDCKRGLGALREYHAHYNEGMQVYSAEPVHNWASHGADAFMTMAQSNFQNSSRPTINFNVGTVMRNGP